MLEENSNTKLFRKPNNNSKYRCNKIVLYMCTYRTESTSDGYNAAAFLLLSSSLSLPNMKLYESAEKFDEVSLTKHCFLLNMSMDGCSVRWLFSALSYV